MAAHHIRPVLRHLASEDHGAAVDTVAYWRRLFFQLRSVQWFLVRRDLRLAREANKHTVRWLYRLVDHSSGCACGRCMDADHREPAR